MVAVGEEDVAGSVAEAREHGVSDVVVDFLAAIGEAVGRDEIEVGKFADGGLNGGVFEFGYTDYHRVIITYSGEIFWNGLLSKK